MCTLSSIFTCILTMLCIRNDPSEKNQNVIALDQKVILDVLPQAEGAAFNSHAEGEGTTCHPDTRVDLLRQIYEWANKPASEAIFWLNGMAGTGKSTISRTVARTFAERGQLGASFFFKRSDGDRGMAAKFFTTIAAQLVLAEPSLAQHVQTAVDSDPALVGKAMREQLEKLILEPLSKLSQGGARMPNYVIVIDALDECESGDDSKLILNLISLTKTLTSSRLRIFLTSRPELSIRLGFRATKNIYQDCVLQEIPEPVIEHDISKYLWSQLARIRDDFNAFVPKDRQIPMDWPDRPKVQHLVDMSIPFFIFATTVCRFLADHDRTSPAQQLQTIMAYQIRSQESKLDAIYRLVLDKLIIGLPTERRTEVLDRFRVIVGSIVTLASPLSAASLGKISPNIPGSH